VKKETFCLPFALIFPLFNSISFKRETVQCVPVHHFFRGNFELSLNFFFLSFLSRFVKKKQVEQMIYQLKIRDKRFFKRYEKVVGNLPCLFFQCYPVCLRLRVTVVLMTIVRKTVRCILFQILDSISSI